MLLIIFLKQNVLNQLEIKVRRCGFKIKEIEWLLDLKKQFYTFQSVGEHYFKTVI